MLDYYKTLHVSENASQEDIKKSYRKLAMKWHPDRNKGDKKAEEKFKEVQTAYDTLSDPQKRREYDMGGQFAYSNRSRGSHFTDANDFFKSHFSSIFEDNFSDFFRQQSFVHSLELNIGFWEAINGTSKAFQIGIQNGDKIKTSDVKIEIPKGANTGDTFLVEIEGQKIQIILDVSRDEKFERHNLDLYLNIYLPFTTAILGDKMIFPHWDGDIEISLPGNLQNGQKILISNKGVTKGVFKGDLYLIVNIIIPNNITSKQKEILEQFRKTETQSNIFSNIKDYLKKQFKF